MNPIPLSSPEGTIYGYACGVCHHVCCNSSRMVKLDAPDRGIVRSSLLNAESCCTCLQCRQPTTGEWRSTYCSRCNWWHEWASLWLSIGSAMREGITTPEGWLAFLNVDDD